MRLRRGVVLLPVVVTIGLASGLTIANVTAPAATHSGRRVRHVPTVILPNLSTSCDVAGETCSLPPCVEFIAAAGHAQPLPRARLVRAPPPTCVASANRRGRGVSARRKHLRAALLYLVCDEQTDEFLRAVLGAGVDLIQLRMKDAGDREIVAAGGRFARAAPAHGALFILNDRPDLVEVTGADGVHVGQDDVAVAEARATVGPDRL